MELIAEKGHPFAEELEKVSNVVCPQGGIFFLSLRPGDCNRICHSIVTSSMFHWD